MMQRGESRHHALCGESSLDACSLNIYKLNGEGSCRCSQTIKRWKRGWKETGITKRTKGVGKSPDLPAPLRPANNHFSVSPFIIQLIVLESSSLSLEKGIPVIKVATSSTGQFPVTFLSKCLLSIRVIYNNPML